MQKQFTKILVPVCFNHNTRWTALKALQMANKFNCDLIWLHILTPANWTSLLPRKLRSELFKRFDKSEAAGKMNELEAWARNKLKDGLLMKSLIVTGQCQAVLKDAIIGTHADLVLVPKSGRRFGNPLLRRININRLTQQAQCPVMTITKRFTVNHLDNVIVPVNDFLPIKKLTIATYLSVATNSRIHLVSGSRPGTENNGKKFLIKAYQLLTDFGGVKIQCTLPDKADSAENTLAYARNINADLIVVYTGTESRLKGWWNRLLGRYLCSESDIPVLTIDTPNSEFI